MIWVPNLQLISHLNFITNSIGQAKKSDLVNENIKLFDDFILLIQVIELLKPLELSMLCDAGFLEADNPMSNSLDRVFTLVLTILISAEFNVIALPFHKAPLR